MDFSHLFEPVPQRDWLIIALLFVGIVILIGSSEALRRRLGWPEEVTRKFVHILVGLMMFFIPILLRTSLPMVLIAAFFTLSNYLALKMGILKGMHGARESYGTVFYPLSFLILVLLAWPEHLVLIIAAMMVLALGDAAAAIVGENLRHPHEYRLIADRKSWEGSAAMFLVSAAVLFLVLHFYPYDGPASGARGYLALWYALVTATLTTAAEALSRKGSDNLSVPLTVAIILYYLLNHSPEENLRFTAGMLLGGLVALLSFRLRFLTASGAVATFLLAAIIFGFGGWKWTLPILTFFVLSSLLSLIGKTVKTRYDLIFEKGSRRDYAQVLANGGVAGALMILFMFYRAPEIYFLYLGALAAATADTWATEIGTLAQQQPRLITTLRPVPPGTSGGVTAAGSLSAFSGALVIALCGWTYFRPDFDLGLLFLITASGFLGSMVDSVLGATLQIQFRCPSCHKITEKLTHCQERRTTPVSGISWINNDLVNFMSTLSALLFVLLGKIFLWGLYP